MKKTFTIPELGEDISSGLVSKVFVKKGEILAIDQSILELETDKAVIEIPSTVEGKIIDIMVNEGDEVTIGQEILTVEAVDNHADADSDSTKKIEVEAEVEAEVEVESGGVTEKKASEELSGGDLIHSSKQDLSNDEERIESKKDVEGNRDEEKTQPAMSEEAVRPDHVREIAPASPSVRRFAREIGLSIDGIPGSGPGGRISLEDVKSFSREKQKQVKAVPMQAVQWAETLPDFSKWGGIERKPLSLLRKTSAKHLAAAWSTIPHVTHFDKADITGLEEFRSRFSGTVEAAGGKLTVTIILLKIVAQALRRFPQFNASIDMEAHEMIFKKYVNISVAVDTDRGLLVPVVRDVDRKGLTTLAVEVGNLAKKARERKLLPDEMQGGNFSISNLGGIGGQGFTPVIHSPDVAILAVSRAAMEPVYRDGNFVPRLMLPLGLSYDHRAIDGADAARFLRWVCEAIEQPLLLFLEADESPSDLTNESKGAKGSGS